MPLTQSLPPSRKSDAFGDAWIRYAMLGLLVAAIAVSVWNGWEVNHIKKALPGIVKNEIASIRPSDVFMSVEEGWGLGQFAPDVPVTDPNGKSISLRRLAEQHAVIYLAWDECKVCQKQFPELSTYVPKLERQMGSFAIVTRLTKAGLEDLRSQYQWDFPMYSIDERSLLDLNIQGTPVLLVFRNGVLSEAHSGSVFQDFTASLAEKQ